MLYSYIFSVTKVKQMKYIKYNMQEGNKTNEILYAGRKYCLIIENSRI